MKLSWASLREVSWTSRALGSLLRSREFMESRFGKPVLVDLDSNGVGLFDAWLIRFPCGLEVALWLFHLRPDLTPIIDRNEPAVVEIYANRSEQRHILFHLGFTRDEVEWIPEAPAEPCWQVWRLDDNGNEYEVAGLTSACKAEAMVEEFEARGHKQTYWVAARTEV